MSPAVAAAFLVISLSAQVFAAPYICTTCQTSNTHRSYQTHSSGTDNLSHQRSENLEDLTQQAESILGTSQNDQLAFDNTRPGDWTDVNRYRTPDGHGQVYEEQGQRVNGPTRVRFYRKNFTSSYSSGNLNGLATPDLSGFGLHNAQGSSQLADQHLSVAQQLALNQRESQGSYGHTGSSTFRQTTAHGNSFGSQGVLNPTIGGTGYSGTSTSGFREGSTLNGQSLHQGVLDVDQQRPESTAFGQGALNAGLENSGFSETSSSTFREGSTLGGHTLQQGVLRGDQQRPGNWTTANTYRTDGGNGRVWEERGQVVRGPTRVQYFRKNYTSSHSSGGTIPTIDRGVGEFGGNSGTTTIDELRRQFGSQGRDINQIGQHLVNDGYYRHDDEYHRRTGSPVDQTNHRYVSGSGNYESQNRDTSGSNSHHTYEFHHGHGIDDDDHDYDQDHGHHHHHHHHHHNHEHSTGDTSECGSQETQQVISGGKTEAVGSINSQSGSQYGGSSQSRPAGNERVYGSSGWNQDQTSTSHFNREASSQHLGSYGTGVQPGRGHHYEQFQTFSSSGVSRPDIDRRLPALNGNEELQQTQNVNFDQTMTHNHGTNYGIRSGDLTTQGIDLGQMSRDAQAMGAGGLAGRTHSYHRSEHQRFYRGVNSPEDFGQQTEDLTQQTEDITQQTEDLTQQTQDLTQQTEDLTQQTQDLTQQTQDFTQQSEDLSQQTQQTQQSEDLTQQTQDLTQQTQDFTQQSEDLSQQTQQITQQTEDLTQQTQDLTQQTEDLTQQTQDLTQQTQDFTQQSEDLSQQTQQITQQSEDLTQQTEDLTQQTQDLTQQTQDFTQQSEDLSQQTQQITQQSEDLTQQSEDLTQQTEDLTQQTQDLTQQTQDFTQQSQDLSQRTQQITQQSENLSQQTQDLTHQVQDFTQQNQDLTQQTQDRTQQVQDYTQPQDFSQQNQEITQQSEDLTQQTEDLTQQTEDLTQQTQDFTQQSQDLSQQTQQIMQQSEDLTQQTEDLTQQTEDLTQQTVDLSQQTQGFQQDDGKIKTDVQIGEPNHIPYIEKPLEAFEEKFITPEEQSMGYEQTEDLFQQSEDLTQQTEDLFQQSEDLTQQTQDLFQQTEDLTQQKPDFTQHGQDLFQQTEDLTQQSEDLTQQTEDLTQQTQDLTQQIEDLTQQKPDFTQHGQDLSQQTEDLTQQSEDLTQQTEDLTQQTQDLTQQSEDLTQQTEDLTQQTEDLTQQTEDLTQQTEDLTQQTEDLAQQTEDEQTHWQHIEQIGNPNHVPHVQKPPGFLYEQYFTPQGQEIGNEQEEDLVQQTEDLTQQTEDLTQQTEDLTQQTEDLTQQTQDFTQQNQDLTQQTEDLFQQSEDLTQQTENLNQQTEDLTQQTQDFTQQNQDLTQQTEDLFQQSEDLTQQTENLNQQTEDLTQHSEDLSQQSGYNDDWANQRLSSSQFLQGVTLKNYEQTVQQPSKPASKPAAKPKRIRLSHSYVPHQVSAEEEDATVLFAESQPIPAYAQQNIQKWETADELYQNARESSVPQSPNRGDQSFDINSNEPEFYDTLIGTNHETSQVLQTDFVPSYQIPPVQQITSENQFGQVQTTKTKTRTRLVYHPQFDRSHSWEARRDQQPPKDVTSSQGPAIRYTDATRNSHYLGNLNHGETQSTVGIEQEVQQSRVNGAENEPVRFGQLSRSTAAPVVIGTRILEAFGGNTPDNGENPDIFASVSPNPSATFAPNSDEKYPWVIYYPPVEIPTTSTEAPIAETTTTTTTTTTPAPTTTAEPTTTTPAPSGFWNRFSNRISSTYDKAKEKAIDFFG